MSNPFKDEFDRESLIKDIAERADIIVNYQKSGFLDRNNAVRKILELRINDKDVEIITAAKLSKSSTPFAWATNDRIVKELDMQKAILQTKLIEKQMEGKCVLVLQANSESG